MSLRTKLLAFIVGLPVAILLLALGLFVRRGPETPHSAINRVIEIANRKEWKQVRRAMLDLLDSGAFKAGWVVRTASARRARPPHDGDADGSTSGGLALQPAAAWTLHAYYAEAPGQAAQVADPVLRKALIDRLTRVVGLAPPMALTEHYLVVRALRPDLERRDYGFVFELHSRPRTAQTVYWVMVVGIALLMTVMFVVVQRWVIRPLRKLSAAADRIAEGDYAVEIGPHPSNDEFGRTIRALHRMAREIAEYQGHLEDRVLTALSRIKKAEQHLTIAQRLAATGKLASGLAHEINNPLGGMKNAVRALTRGDLSPEKTSEYLELVADGLVRVEQTVKKFLSFTPRRVEPRPSDLGDIVRKSIALSMHHLEKRHIRVEVDAPEAGGAIVFGDPHELQQVALNLILNAADAIGAGPEGCIRVAVEPREDLVLLRVEDNGSGMSPDDQAHCFDMFFTTKDVGEGSGMGLSVVHNIVSNHGGRIEVTSRLGEGTVFEVVLPREGALEAAREAQGAAPGALGAGGGGAGPGTEAR
jgi:signal transduction histidine kinase